MTGPLLDLAYSMGVTVEYARLRNRDGEYRHDLQRIRLRRGMTERMERSILAHEIGHAVHQDPTTLSGPIHMQQERRADSWAAQRLITPDAYRDAEERWNGHVPSMAYELGVIARLVDAYRTQLLRTDAAIYLAPRMGRGQWLAKSENLI